MELEPCVAYLLLYPNHDNDWVIQTRDKCAEACFYQSMELKDVIVDRDHKVVWYRRPKWWEAYRQVSGTKGIKQIPNLMISSKDDFQDDLDYSWTFMCRTVRHRGGRLYDIQGNRLEIVQTDEDKLFEDILTAKYRFERALMQGAQVKPTKDKRVSHGYGSRPEEKWVVEKMLAMHRQEYHPREIVAELNRLLDESGNPAPRKAKRWSVDMVQRIVLRHRMARLEQFENAQR
jgi:hypothetical protein